MANSYTNCIQLRSRSIIVYNKFERTFGLRTGNQQLSDKLLKERATKEGETYQTYSGRLCPGAKKRLTKAVELISQAAFKDKRFKYTPKGTLQEITAKFKLNFITLTIHSPDKMIAGKDGHRLCLEPMLRWMRDKTDNDFMYIWKAELQERGQLHYHLTTNCFIDWRELWCKWGELNERAGYLDDWFSTNSRWKIDDRGMQVVNYPVAGTDIHSVYKVADMARYLMKCVAKTTKKKDGSIISEFAKDVQNAATVGGKVWDCSVNLKSAKYYTIDIGGSITEDLLHNIRLEARKPGNSSFYSDNCTVYKLKKPAYQVLDKFWQDDYFKSLNKMLRFVREPFEIRKIADLTLFSSS